MILIGLLSACSGELLVELGSTELAFETEDGCSVQFDSALAMVGGLALGEEQADASYHALDLSSGPHALSAPAGSGSFDIARAQLARHGEPDSVDEAAQALVDSGASLMVAGTVTCSTETAFELDFHPDTVASCELESPYASGSDQVLELELDLARIFSDSLIDGEGLPRGQPWELADSDGDGVLTTTEIELMELAPLGYTVGSYSSALDLLDQVRHASGQVLGVPGADCTHRCLAEDAC